MWCHRLLLELSFFNSHPHKEDDIHTYVSNLCNYLFNSHPHKEDDVELLQIISSRSIFNSHPHKEDDESKFVVYYRTTFSTHILTRRMTFLAQSAYSLTIFSTHILTRRMT